MACYRFAREDSDAGPLSVSLPGVEAVVDDGRPVVHTSDPAVADLFRSVAGLEELEVQANCDEPEVEVTRSVYEHPSPPQPADSLPPEPAPVAETVDEPAPSGEEDPF